MRPLIGPRGQRHRHRSLLGLAPLLGAAILAGCGGSTTTTTVSQTIVAASHLQFTITLTERAGQACTTEHYAVVGAKVRNFPQTSRFCGPVGQAAPPRLIQVARPTATLIVDRPARCGPVALGHGQAHPAPATSKCSPATPHLRLTLVPAGRLFKVTGVAGVGRLDLARTRCAFICTRQLAAAG